MQSESELLLSVDEGMATNHPRVSNWLRSIILLAIHLFCCIVYILPVKTHNYRGGPVLDESHIVSNNKDVDGSTPLQEIFVHDYWGRPMNSPNSHKSWRPLSILSFRWLRGGSLLDPLFSHRLLNIIANAATAEFVSLLAIQLFPTFPELPLRVITKLLFALHPTHVEVTVNAANRPHLLAVLCATAISSPQLHILCVIALQIAGLLCSETFLFQMPAVCCTLIVIVWRHQGSGVSNEAMVKAILSVLPRIVVLFVSSVAYLLLRVEMQWVSIPEGLIRPAENPFFLLQGWHRVRNYSYILAIHVGKSIQLDFVGMSQEYGFECIKELHGWSDPRFIVPISVVLLTLYAGNKCWGRGMDFFAMFAIYLSWFLTLFPVSGLLKVGTFVSDRIVVASTVPYSILLGAYLCHWATAGNNKLWRYIKAFPIALMFLVMWYRAHHRSLAWMDPYELLNASLQSCPRSAKNHLEISKVFSSYEYGKYDLERARSHLEKVESIDPTYCDLHQQFAMLHAQMNQMTEFERRLANAVLCPFSVGWAMDVFQKYWRDVAENDPARQRRAFEYREKVTKAVDRQVLLREKFNAPEWLGGTLELADDKLYNSKVLGL